MVVPCLEISSDVSFLVDTGADYTALMPMDGRRCRYRSRVMNLINWRIPTLKESVADPGAR